MRFLRNKTFTLVEILITSSLILIVGLAVYSVVNSGISLFKRLSKPYLEEDVSIFFDKISKELRGSFSYKGIEFLGEKESLKFPTLITSSGHLSSLKVEPGEVSYVFNPKEKKIERTEKDLSTLYRKSKGQRRTILEGVESLRFKYYFYDPHKEDYFWVDSYKNFPLAVRIELVLNYEGKTYDFSKTVNIPTTE